MIIPGWLETLATIVLIVSAVCAVIVLGDIIAGRHQKMWVMNLVWPITALYFGPLGLWAYWTMGRPEAKKDDAQSGDEDQSPKKPFWQTTLVATRAVFF